MPLYACAKLFTRAQSSSYACETTGFHSDVFFVTRRYFFPYDRFTGLPFAFALTVTRSIFSTLLSLILIYSADACNLVIACVDCARVQLKTLSSLLKRSRTGVDIDAISYVTKYTTKIKAKISYGDQINEPVLKRGTPE